MTLFPGLASGDNHTAPRLVRAHVHAAPRHRRRHDRGDSSHHEADHVLHRVLVDGRRHEEGEKNFSEIHFQSAEVKVSCDAQIAQHLGSLGFVDHTAIV